MKRYLEEQIRKDLRKKMVFIGGPRQVGKTTLALQIGSQRGYLNWDDRDHREKILKRELPATEIVIFDELHKYKTWRNYLKGLYDTRKEAQKFLITGSARLDYYRRGGDSLQGRYFYLRLHPITLDELGTSTQKDLESLFHLGGFPEPFLSGNQIDAQRWSRLYRQRLFEEDILKIEVIEDVGNAELLLLRLPELVGAPLSIENIRHDLGVSFKAVKRWLMLFEFFYAIFFLSPFGAPQIRAVKKERKHYHFDWVLIKDKGHRFENMIACHLLKWVHFLQDVEGRDVSLCYFKDREKREVDFVIEENKEPICFIEAKLSENSISPSLNYLKRKFPNIPAFQLVMNTKKDFVNQFGVRLGPANKLIATIKDTLLQKEVLKLF